MTDFTERLFQSRFLVVLLGTALASFVLLYVAETYFGLAPRVAQTLQGVATALLTSGGVGFVFEYLTRQEFTEVVRAAMQSELAGFERQLLGRSEVEDSLKEFWGPFVTDGARIVVAQDETGKEPTARIADVSAALTLYQGLLRAFLLPINAGTIEIDFVSKTDSSPNDMSLDKHLIIIGAPGANPLATQVLLTMRAKSLASANVKNGYVFAVDKSSDNFYLASPYVIPAGADAPGIWDLADGSVNSRYARHIPTSQDMLGRDCCLLVRGVIARADGFHMQVLIIAGHSRNSTMDGVGFVLSNHAWATAIQKLAAPNTESIITVSTSLAHGRIVNLAPNSPRPIKVDQD